MKRMFKNCIIRNIQHLGTRCSNFTTVLEMQTVCIHNYTINFLKLNSGTFQKVSVFRVPIKHAKNLNMKRIKYTPPTSGITTNKQGHFYL
jgi:hypothetical protein